MSETLAAPAPIEARRPHVLTLIRESMPSRWEIALAAGSAILLILAFPNFEFWWLAWIGLVPLLFAVATTSRKSPAFVLGLIWGTIFFYGTCWWLTYPMIHYGGVSAWLAYPLLLLPVVFVSLFTAVACTGISLVVKRFGSAAIFIAPIIWVAFDWLRGAVTGFDWNALGIRRRFIPWMIWSDHPAMIQAAKVGGVHAVTFLIVLTSAVHCAHTGATRRRTFIVSAAVVLVVTLIIVFVNPTTQEASPAFDFTKDTLIVGVQPNVADG
jgi:apolipoprotein N-acyltransferase